MKTLIKLIDKVEINICEDLKRDFNQIILDKITGNYGTNKEALKEFLTDMQKGGCISGMIGEFIYHADNKEFYIKHIEALEEFKEQMEDEIGEAVKNRHRLVHYTFIVWLCFEEYCYTIYNQIFEQ